MLTQEALNAYIISPHDNSASQIAATVRARHVTIKQVIAPRLQSGILSSITVKRQYNQYTFVAMTSAVVAVTDYTTASASPHDPSLPLHLFKLPL